MLLKRIKSPILRYLVIGLMTGVACLFVFIASVYLGAWGKLPNKTELSNFEYQRASEVFTADSVLIGKYYLYDRQPIAYNDLPKTLLEGLIAIEDERFYEHSGVDYKSLLRVAFKTILLQDKSAGGGSTLTQQLAKNLYPRENRIKATLSVNKIKEIIIASRLEKIYSKEELLTLYINTVSFGGNTFGIESAALKFFNKRAKHLNTQEAATLVGMLKATYGYNPRIFPEQSLKRRNLVLQSMYNNEYLSKTQKDSIVKLPLELNYKEFDHNTGLAPYFREEVRKQIQHWIKVQNKAGKSYNIYTSGLKIYTTLDYKMQLLAEKAMAKHMASLQKSFEKSYGKSAPWISNKRFIKKLTKASAPYKQLIRLGVNEDAAWDSLQQKKLMVLTDWNGDKNVTASTIDSLQHYIKFLNTGSLAMVPRTGAVKTWIGGINYKYFKYDHISQAKRQVGSTFKPIVYTAAIEKGIDPCTYFSAQEVEYKNMEGWSPSNAGDKDETYLNYSMEQALSNSVNTVAVKVLEKTGIPVVIDQAKKMGISATLPNKPSLALGTGEITIEELAGAYASYLNKGRPVKPFLITGITDSKNATLASFEPTLSNEPAFSEETGLLMLEMLKETVDTGTASRIRSKYGLGNDIAGKTGTTQNNKDAWFVGITPNLIHVTWVGLNNYEIGFKSTSLGQGASAALPIFALWYQQLNQDRSFNYLTKAKFQEPNTSLTAKLDCRPIKKDGFFKRLFKNPKKKKTKKFKNSR
ncbi:transglycosylase domain-containing protein [Spongiimicrobium sp. 3-5]|uniref:transglycosylase domain-containing protein n=1 Tax=Spongiimicrobium sp. 3-5 TaxID=3332596 RepID=UPI0039807A44